MSNQEVAVTTALDRDEVLRGARRLANLYQYDTVAALVTDFLADDLTISDRFDQQTIRAAGAVLVREGATDLANLATTLTRTVIFKEASAIQRIKRYATLSECLEAFMDGTCRAGDFRDWYILWEAHRLIQQRREGGTPVTVINKRGSRRSVAGTTTLAEGFRNRRSGHYDATSDRWEWDDEQADLTAALDGADDETFVGGARGATDYAHPWRRGYDPDDLQDYMRGYTSAYSAYGKKREEEWGVVVTTFLDAEEAGLPFSAGVDPDLTPPPNFRVAVFRELSADAVAIDDAMLALAQFNMTRHDLRIWWSELSESLGFPSADTLRDTKHLATIDLVKGVQINSPTYKLAQSMVAMLTAIRTLYKESQAIMGELEEEEERRTRGGSPEQPSTSTVIPLPATTTPTTTVTPVAFAVPPVTY